jgi:hypothetical protein
LLRTARTAARIALVTTVSGLLALACREDRGTPLDPGDTAGGGAVPDFSLLDVNETSTTAGELVSPRDQLGRVSAWYFGHAT